MRLGILDPTQTEPGGDARQALQNAVETIVMADAAGYSRYWLAQHYSSDVAQTTPEVLIAILAGLTERIRVGAAGILLHYDTPLRAANAFRLLETIYRGRVDLGVARGTVPGPIARALESDDSRNPSAEGFAARFQALCRFARGGATAPAEPMACPEGSSAPRVWGLGTTGVSAALASRHATAFSHSLFLATSVADPDVIRAYRDDYVPTPAAEAPEANVAVAGFCADTEGEARARAAAYDGRFLVPLVVGRADQCLEQLAAIADRHRVDEVIYLDLAVHGADRRRAYASLGERLAGRECQ